MLLVASFDTSPSEGGGTTTYPRRSLRSLFVGGGSERDCSSLLASLLPHRRVVSDSVSPKAGRSARGRQGRSNTARALGFVRSMTGRSVGKRTRGAQTPRELLASFYQRRVVPPEAGKRTRPSREMELRAFLRS